MTIDNALGFLPEMEDKTLLLETTYTLDREFRGRKLGLFWKPPPQRSYLIALKGPPKKSSEKKKNDQYSQPAVTPANKTVTKMHSDETYILGGNQQACD